MLKDNILNTLTGYYKKQRLQQQYNNDKTRLTADNINAIISGLVDLSQYDSELSGLITNKLQQLNTTDGVLNSDIRALSSSTKTRDDQLEAKIIASQSQGILSISATIASAALSAQHADIADTANYATQAGHALAADTATAAAKLNNNLSIYTNEIDQIIFDGSVNKVVKQILSSIFTVQAQHSIDSDNALTANYSYQAGYTTNALAVLNMDGDSIIYNGSQEVLVSSIASAYTAIQSETASIATSAEFDINGNQLNTLTKYNEVESNDDYPILFSREKINNVQSETNYEVNFNQSIVINPYIKAIKANYFIGTAVSATYAELDYNKNQLNTRVRQNTTENNLQYPITLAYIDNTNNPKDGESNELLYSTYMRLNPYTNTIYASINSNGAGYADFNYIKNNNNSNFPAKDNYLTTNNKHEINPTTIEPNFVGLVTRAVYDIYGYPNNTRVLMHPISTNQTIYLLGKGTISSNLAKENDINNLNIGQPVFANTLYYNNNTLTTPNENITTNLTVGGIATINGNTNIKGNTNIEGNTVIKGNLTLSSTNSSTKLSGSLEVKQATTLYNSLYGSSTITAKSNIQSTDGNLIIKGTGSFANGSVLITSNKVTANTFAGVALSANWADLAQVYQTDQQYSIGILVQYGGQKQMTIATNQVNGVISEKPGYIMNSSGKGQPIVMIGKTKVLVKGKVKKFDKIILSDQPGIGIVSNNSNNIIARALQTNDQQKIKLVYCTVRFNLG